MFFKKRSRTDDSASKTEVTKEASSEAERGSQEGAQAEAIDTSKCAPADRAVKGPYDISEVPQIRPYIDLGAIKVAPREGLQVRLDIEQVSQRIIAVSVDYEGSTLQAQAFSAPKTTGVWNQSRAAMHEQLLEQGAEVTAQQGTFGPELIIVPAAQEQKTTVRCFGVDGPRWMLRAIIVGPAATDSARAAGIESVFREMVVVRGESPIPPGEILLLQLPEAGEFESGLPNSQEQ
ncbi:DUF3710 domain-containing protein [Canibacter sp. lx-72]|uniref:DUF3710 domain-containing protein n=1 Tax=Canibacter zhuwentaonis TaxID=2837491 RepID=UPI001BDBFED7|nr:DUF3710 domain-containing protein [Canibacter zhuwentaonis]MBT1017976.1 DUF3710 domain-containing protein [Canibacter zhuwentaonis]